MDRSVAQGRPADPTADPADPAPDDVLVALGFERIAIRRRYGMLLAMTLIVTSPAVNAWGGLWSRILGW